MKLCISSTGPHLEASVDPRFGRCQYFLFVDTETMSFESVVNPALMAGGGAGVQAAQLTVNKGAEVILTGNIGPNAFQALQAAGLKIATGVTGSVKEVIEKFKKGELQYTGTPTVDVHFGKGR